MPLRHCERERSNPGAVSPSIPGLLRRSASRNDVGGRRRGGERTRTEKRPRIGVVGSSNVDVVTYIERMPVWGETIAAPRFEMSFGGKGANQAAAAAKLGADVVMVSKVGCDLLGEN